MQSQDIETLQARIDSLAPWMARHELAPGVLTPIAPGSSQARQPEYDSARAEWIYSLLEQTNEQGVRGLRVMDFACASGFLVFEALKRGAAQGLGMDGRELHVRQGRFIAETLGYDNVTFQVMDTTRLLRVEVEPADVVMFLDTLQAVANPIGVLHRLANLTQHILVLTVIFYVPPVNVPLSRQLPERQALMLLRTEDSAKHNKKGLESLVVTPTYEATLEMLWSLDFPQIFQLIPPAEWNDPGQPLGHFSSGKRAAFVALRHAVPVTEALREKAVELMPGVMPPTQRVFPLQARPVRSPTTPNVGRLRRALGRRLVALGCRVTGEQAK